MLDTNYPANPETRPVLILKRVNANLFVYMILLAGNKGYDAMQRGFDRCVDFLLRHAWIAAITFTAMVALAIYMFTSWPTTFIPDEDDGYFIVSVQLPPAASLSRTEQVSREIEGIIAQYPEVKTYITISGFSILNSGKQSNAASVFVVLKDWSLRKEKSQAAATAVNRAKAYSSMQ